MNWYDNWINNDPNDDSYNVVGANTVRDMIEAALKEERARMNESVRLAAKDIENGMPVGITLYKLGWLINYHVKDTE